MNNKWVKPSNKNLLKRFDDCDWFGLNDGGAKLNPKKLVGP